MAQKPDHRPEALTGRVTRELVRHGTASEHFAVMLHTSNGERLILQRIGGNPFDDHETNELIGREISVEGFRLNDIFRYRQADMK